jgi:hypothetical protein
MPSSQDSDDDAPLDISPEWEAPEVVAAATVANEELITALIARLMPNLE